MSLSRRRERVMPADIAVLGAGPAGLAAAAAARRAGAQVTVIDSNPRGGGQYWRHRVGDDGPPARLRDIPVDFRLRHQVWHVERAGDGFVVHTDHGEVPARTLIVATGAYDRQVPFP